MTFVPGEQVGPYQILEQLGQGGMATVYKAYHAALERYVAIKVLHPAFLEDDNFKSRFLREARLVARLEHPNIVPVYDFSEHKGQPYLVMKFIEGETLKARMMRGPLAAEEVLRIVDAVGKALQYAHDQGVLHRDIKPSNVILARDGNIYLADFGLARIAQAGSATLTSDMIIGTPQYIAPEQALGRKDLDERVDVYSLGVMLYEIAVGRVPYNADTPFAIIHDHIYTPLPLPRTLNPNVPEAVERVLLKALAKERDDRYASVQDLTEAFKQAWVSSGVLEHPETLALAREPLPPPPMPDAPTVQPSQTLEPPPLPETKQTPQAEMAAAAARPARPWGWFAAGAALALAFLFVLGALRAANQDFPPPTALDRVPASRELPPDVPSNPDDATDTPAVREALRAVADSPDDPWAYYQLGMAFLASDRLVPALEQFRKAGEVSGEPEEMAAMADEAASQGVWPAAAVLYYQATRSWGADTPAEIWDALYEAVYEVGAMPEAPTALEWKNWERVDANLKRFVQARYQFYNGDPQQAYALLDELYQIDPAFPPAMFLEAEFALQEGRTDDAFHLLTELQQMPYLPDWMAWRVAEMLNEIP